MEFKICSKKDCDKNGALQPLTEFYFRKDRNNFTGNCKSCFKRYNKNLPQNKKDQKKLNSQQWRKNNLDRTRAISKIWRENNKEQKNLKERERYKNLPQDVKVEKINKGNVRRKERACENPLLRMIDCRRSRRGEILNQIKIKSFSKNAINHLGCTPIQWKEYIENKFYNDKEAGEQMKWENYGKNGWHLDETIPISAWKLDVTDEQFGITNEQRQTACWHYLNSQPLWALDNKKKGGSNRKNYTAEINQFIMVLRALDILQ